MKGAYTHDYSGKCVPNTKTHHWNRTFSFGIFQWIPKSSCKGLKKSVVKYRIIGPTTKSLKMHKRADLLCRLLDAGWIPDKKSETIK
jgi:hypothetical protein